MKMIEVLDWCFCAFAQSSSINDNTGENCRVFIAGIDSCIYSESWFILYLIQIHTYYAPFCYCSWTNREVFMPLFPWSDPIDALVFFLLCFIVRIHSLTVTLVLWRITFVVLGYPGCSPNVRMRCYAQKTSENSHIFTLGYWFFRGNWRFKKTMFLAKGWMKMSLQYNACGRSIRWHYSVESWWLMRRRNRGYANWNPAQKSRISWRVNIRKIPLKIW